MLEEADDEGRELVVVSGTAELFVGESEGEVCEKGPSTSLCIAIGAGAERVAAMVISGRSGGKTTAVDRTKFETREKSRDQLRIGNRWRLAYVRKGANGDEGGRVSG